MKKYSSLLEWFLPFLLIIFGFTARLLPHAPNFTPIGSIALFGGMYLPRKLSIIAPLAAMLASDAIIGFYSWQIMISVYASFAIMGVIGLWVREHKRFSNVIGGTLLGSTLFFLITNGAVWAFSTMYTLTFQGLLQSYAMGLPFFRNSLLGDLFYVGFLVGSYEFIRYWIASREVSLVKKQKEVS